MRCYNFFKKWGGWQDELKQPLNATDYLIQDEKPVSVAISDSEIAEMDQEAVETICERLDLIKEKLVSETSRIKIQRAQEAKGQANIITSIANFAVSGISSYGFYRMIPILKDLTSLTDQAYQNFYHQPVNNQTCNQVQNSDLYCSNFNIGYYDSLINILNNQVLSLAIDVSQVCQKMHDQYCELRFHKNGSAFAATLIGIIALTTLGAGCYYAYFRRKKGNCCSSCIEPDNVFASKILAREDQEFLDANSIQVINQTVEQMIHEIGNKKIDLRIKQRPNYAPTIFKQIVEAYLDPNDRNDLDGRKFMRSL